MSGRELPAGWAATPLINICNRVTDGTHQSPTFEADGIPFLVISNIISGEIDWQSVRKWISHDTYSTLTARVQPERGDVLYTAVGSYGTAVAVHDDRPFAFQRHIAHIKPKSSIVDADFLSRWLNSPEARRKADTVARGVAQKTVTLGDLAEFEVPLAPLPEQRRIVEKIEALTARSRRAREALDVLPALIDRYRQSILAAAFRGELTAAWRTEESCGAATEAQLAGYSDDELIDRRLPSGWEWVSVADLASAEPYAIQSGPFGSDLKHSEFQREGVLVIGIDNVRDGVFSAGRQNRISREKYGELIRFKARPQDVLITVMATIGRCCVVPGDIEDAIITKHVYRITSDKERVDPYYLMNALRGSQSVLNQIEKKVRGQTRPGINGSILKELMIPIAPLPEQREIARKIDWHFEFINRIQAALDMQRVAVDKLEQSILAKAFRGELVPQNPDDEPASVLLERIRAERAAAGDGAVRRRQRKEKAPC